MPTLMPSDEELLRELLDEYVTRPLIEQSLTAMVQGPPSLGDQITSTVRDEPAMSISEMARRFAEFNNLPLVARNEFRTTYVNPPAVIRRADTFDFPALSQHGPRETQNLDDSELRDDDTNSDVVNRWANSTMTTAERDRMQAGCPCQSCTRAHYERVEAIVGPQPEGYHADCGCHRCRGWRRLMALGIQAVILREGQEGIRQAIGRQDRPYIVIDEVVDGPSPTPSLRAAERMLQVDVGRAQRQINAAMDSFERQRVRRGHPLVKNPLPADWQPNVWEA